VPKPTTTKPTPAHAPKPTMATPSAAKVATGAGAAGAGAGGLSGKAGMLMAAIGTLGITNAYAKQAIVATSAKESGLDPKSKEDGASAYLKTLKNRGIDRIYTIFPQLKPGGRVAKKLGMPNGVPADYLEKEWSKGDEAFFSMVYDDINGNTRPGDGYKFRGRGLIGITGRGIYKRVGDFIGVDLENNPDALIQDFDTAAKAAAGYLAVTMGGKGGPQKGFEIMNSFTDSDSALKSTLRAVAGYGHKAEEFDKAGSHLHEQLRVATPFMGLAASATNTSSPSTGSQLNQASTENKDLKVKPNDGAVPVTINNTTNTQKNSNASTNKQTIDDRSAYQKKAQG
jgi:hypothetical protein